MNTHQNTLVFRILKWLWALFSALPQFLRLTLKTLAWEWMADNSIIALEKLQPINLVFIVEKIYPLLTDSSIRILLLRTVFPTSVVLIIILKNYILNAAKSLKRPFLSFIQDYINQDMNVTMSFLGAISWNNVSERNVSWNGRYQR